MSVLISLIYLYWLTGQGKKPKLLVLLLCVKEGFHCVLTISRCVCSRLLMLQQGLVQQEWRVPQMLQRILEDLLPHLDHPYKAVRDRLGRSVPPPSALVAQLSTEYSCSPGKVSCRAHTSLRNEGCVVVGTPRVSFCLGHIYILA